ncbi:hypothetical protein PHAVU_008G149406 [Phaseolus vulgaris]
MFCTSAGFKIGAILWLLTLLSVMLWKSEAQYELQIPVVEVKPQAASIFGVWRSSFAGTSLVTTGCRFRGVLGACFSSDEKFFVLIQTPMVFWEGADAILKHKSCVCHV